MGFKDVILLEVDRVEVFEDAANFNVGKREGFCQIIILSPAPEDRLFKNLPVEVDNRTIGLDGPCLDAVDLLDPLEKTISTFARLRPSSVRTLTRR